MSTLVIGNSFNDYLVGDLAPFDPLERKIGGNISLRLMWLAEPGDVVVLPQPPASAFLSYLAAFKGIPDDSVTVLVPPPGAFGTDVLTRDRLTEPGFRELLAKTAREHDIDRVLPYVFDQTVVGICAELGIDTSAPDTAFLKAGGSDLLNSKSVFRALAAGAGVATAEGLATHAREAAEAFVREQFELGRPVIVKEDFHQGGHGNEILAPAPGVAQIGATALTVLDGPEAISRHLDERWTVYSNASRNKVVLEHYLPDSVPIGAEVEIGERGVTVRHVGEMRMTPVFDGVVLPGERTTEGQRAEFREATTRLCASVRALGYRGLINVDGVVDSAGRVWFTEYNGRLGGTTHLHWLGLRAVGADYARRAVFVSNNDWQVSSFPEAFARLRRSGLEFDPGTSRGVVITCDHTAQSNAVEYCVVGPDLAAVTEIEAALKRLF
ncbi:peptide ligase PGM1-related protein [Actinomadura chibensis]|uniref:ATP-grasp domain-containing protein n=1 Tax=Actinomadura chibensis TaxID=392828 RepID=A0A5D0NQP6_9ACTN|nr:peptide ligase PGM1-related protein [Actinomadura chibensis]TYB46401.1 ATP-grasp domain-containing protein [Actinomadura chibensis]